MSPCAGCQAEETSYGIRVPDTNEYRSLCRVCYVDQELPISFVFHHPLPDWVRPALYSKETVSTLSRMLRGPTVYRHITVHVLPREKMHTPQFQLRWDSKVYSDNTVVPPYGYRAWSAAWQGQIILLVDNQGIETRESVVWLLYHELTHFMVYHVPFIDHVFEIEDKKAGITKYEWYDDQGHEQHSEEQFCNRVATAHFGECYDRFWFRRQVEQKLGGTK